MANRGIPKTSITEPPTPLDAAVRKSTSESSVAETPLALHSQSPQRVSPVGKSPKRGLLPGAAAALPLTGAAAMAGMKRRAQHSQQPQQQLSNGVGITSRHTSPNPAQVALASLIGGGGMSRPTDQPAPSKLSEPLQIAAEKINVPEPIAEMDSSEVSPVSMGSFGTMEGSGTGNGLTATANDHGHLVAEPAQMTERSSYSSAHGNNGNGSHLAVTEQDGNKAFSYPGPPPQFNEQEDGGTSRGGVARGMSLPGYGQGSPKSPASSSKRHKCPYCSTDFTRHHNLKSHLLTHSQEKPYVCQTCQARFRRLHDLKRHTKLHTGERPHKCNQCGRQFARGDALARHNKGSGGCAGRRSSFGGDDDYGDGGAEGMDGVEYDEEHDQGSEQQQQHQQQQQQQQQGRRISEPNRKRQQLETPQDPNREVYRQHSSTYPPPPTRTMQGSMGPPQVVHPGSSSTATSPRETSSQHSPAPSSYYNQSQVFAEQGMMTSSPKPLSPGQPPEQHRLSVGDGTGAGTLGRNRSTSLTKQFQQAYFGRGSATSGRTPPPPAHQFALQQQGAQLNILPPLGASSQPPPRGGMQPTAVSGNSMPNMSSIQGHHQQQLPLASGLASNPGSHSSHGRSSGSSMREIACQDPGDIWAYVRQLEQRFSRMQDEYELRISRLQEEVISLKGQVGNISNSASYSGDMGPRGPYPG